MAAYLPGWPRHFAVSVQPDAVNANLTNHPVLVKFTAEAKLATARADGQDVRFTLADNSTILPYQRVVWSGGDGSPVTALFWVLVPSISSAVGAEFHVHVGNPLATDGEDAAAVWADYEAVLHLDEQAAGIAGEYADASGNGYDGTAERLGANPFATLEDGVINKSQFLRWSYKDAVAISGELWSGNYQAAFSCWYRTNAHIDHELLSKDTFTSDNSQLIFISKTNDRVGVAFSDGSNHTGIDYTADNSVVFGPWQHVAVTFADNASDGIHVYINGVEDDLSPFSSLGVSAVENDTGKLVRLGTDVSNAKASDGWLEEARFRTAAPMNAQQWYEFHVANVTSVDHELTLGALMEPERSSSHTFWLSHLMPRLHFTRRAPVMLVQRG